MDLYDQTSYELSRHLTQRYSTSFNMSSRLFPQDIRKHIFAIYGLVRIADEVVDTYQGPDAGAVLDELERHMETALQSGYSPNPIVHAYVRTAKRYDISTTLTRPFFASMRMDISPKSYTEALYQEYIYGSAEVIGLMCLKVFTDGDTATYEELAPGARALGAAYQKVNFLRDMRDDYAELGRVYFPGVAYDTFSEEQKQSIVKDIEQDFDLARRAITRLPKNARAALMLSYDYYHSLFIKLQRTDIETIKNRRVRIPDSQKLLLLSRRLVRR